MIESTNLFQRWASFCAPSTRIKTSSSTAAYFVWLFKLPEMHLVEEDDIIIKRSAHSIFQDYAAQLVTLKSIHQTWPKAGCLSLFLLSSNQLFNCFEICLVELSLFRTICSKRKVIWTKYIVQSSPMLIVQKSERFF